MAQNIDKPSIEDEKELNDIINDNKEKLVALGRTWFIGRLKNGTKRKVTDIILNEKEEDKVNSKCAAALLLNGYFKIFFLYWFLWRWFYYIKQYDDAELTPIIEFCKKKVDVEGYLLNIIYLTEMKDTMMMMTREEVNRIRQGSVGEQLGVSEKSTDPSLNP